MINDKSTYKYKVFIFDLDNTIYDEMLYLNKAYEKVVKEVVNRNQNFKYEKKLLNYLIKTRINEGRKNIYQKFILKYKINNFTIDDFLYCLRNVRLKKNSILPYKEIEEYIKKIGKKSKIYILTNGNYIQQRNKYKAIKIPYKDKIKVIYASKSGYEKPDPLLIIKLINKLKINRNNILFIGDSEIDFQTAQNAKIDFLHVNILKKLLNSYGI
ncbi:HAD-IA family hydrolase [Rosettibacter firmus]|uniref:HAD-IA family hydrolase n=1 Tax=Rosettibacter firmus TaxID=3111522 RepID=UPI00336BF662